jgi:hypothetical protein
VDFSGAGPIFDFTRQVSGLEAVTQSALINLGTDQASDPLFPSRGTTLKRHAARGLLLNPVDAKHEANFAALHTTVFLQQQQAQADLQTLRLAVTRFRDQQLRLELQAENRSGQTLGTLAQL